LVSKLVDVQGLQIPRAARDDNKMGIWLESESGGWKEEEV
jgi:hypothetical protein